MQKRIYDLMLKYGFKPDSKYDQNFIINMDPINAAIKALDPKNTENILEIGPGTGNLTTNIIDKCKKIIAIEKDSKLINILEQEFKDKNIEILNEDILKINLKELEFDKIVGFIPYSISQEIIEKINGTKKAILMVQREFAEKLVAIEGFENYVATTVLAQTYGEINFIKNVKKNNFYPKPKVDSAIIEIIPNNKKRDLKYIEFIKTIFRFSNKDLLNSLKLAKKINPKLFKNIKTENVNKNLIKLKVKQIRVEEFEEIYKQIF